MPDLLALSALAAHWRLAFNLSVILVSSCCMHLSLSFAVGDSADNIPGAGLSVTRLGESLCEMIDDDCLAACACRCRGLERNEPPHC